MDSATMDVLQRWLAYWHANTSDAIAIICTFVGFVGYCAFTLFITIASDSTLQALLGAGTTKSDLIIRVTPFLISILLFASIRTVTRVAQTHDIVKTFQQPEVTVAKHNNTDAILQFVNAYKYGSATATIFLGFADYRLIKGLVRLLKADSGVHFRLYVHPGTLKMFLNAGLLAHADRSLNSSPISDSDSEISDSDSEISDSDSHQEISVVDCPRESCVVFARETNVLHCLTARYLPTQGGCWTAIIESNSQFALNLEDTFNQYYRSRSDAAPVPLHAVCVARFLEKAHEDGLAKVKTFITDKTRHFASRERGYQFARHLLIHAHDAVCAVDFMLPEQWDDLYQYEYGHLRLKENGVAIRRIHMYNPENLLMHRVGYRRYIERQNKFGVALYFLHADKAEGLFHTVTTGFIIIDDQVLYADQEDKRRKECAKISFDEEEIKVHVLIFNELMKMNPTPIRRESDIDNLAKTH